MHRSNGFNLLEVLITLLVVAMLVATAVPAMRELILNARLTAAVNDFVHAVHLARQESQKRSQQVELCPRSAPPGCGPGADWSNGWQVTAIAGAGAGPPEFYVLRSSKAPAGLLVAANRRGFTFRPFTLRDTNGTVRFCDERGTRSARAVVISPTGRPRVSLAKEADINIRCPG